MSHVETTVLQRAKKPEMIQPTWWAALQGQLLGKARVRGQLEGGGGSEPRATHP